MNILDETMLQSLTDSVILGVELFLGVAILYGGAHFLFEYIHERRNNKDE